MIISEQKENHIHEKKDASEMQIATSLLKKNLNAFLMLCSSHFQMTCTKHAVINDCF